MIFVSGSPRHPLEGLAAQIQSLVAFNHHLPLPSDFGPDTAFAISAQLRYDANPRLSAEFPAAANIHLVKESLDVIRPSVVRRLAEPDSVDTIERWALFGVLSGVVLEDLLRGIGAAGRTSRSRRTITKSTNALNVPT